MVDEYGDNIGKEKSWTLHNLVSKMLFTTKIEIPDTGTVISYITTRAREPYQSNWLKMVRIFKYIRVTKYLPLILSVDNSTMINWYIYGSYCVHPNMRGHTGGGLTMGKVFPILALIKQKLNTRSST